MKIQRIGKIVGGQDGAIWGHYLFRFDTKGHGSVTDLQAINLTANEEQEYVPFAYFTLDQAEHIVPHSNSVTFGSEYYSPDDEFPLLYTNIYNNYAKSEDTLPGVCCVYRIQREGTAFTTQLVQLISISFTDDRNLWRSQGDVSDVRPYGNFAVDRERGLLYAFVMRDEAQTTRYFSFPLPKLADGAPDPQYGVPKVVLTPADIREAFDCEYHRYMQGACCHAGKIYSCEGFSNNEINRPAIRLISTVANRQEVYTDLMDMGYSVEPEMIDFWEETCLYSDCHGNLFTLEP